MTVAFDFELGPGQTDYPLAINRALREAGRVVWNEAVQGWMLTGYHDIRKAFIDYRRFGNEEVEMRDAFGTEAMLFHDSATHNHIRAVWAHHMLPPAMLQQQHRIAGLADKVLTPSIARLRDGEAVDLLSVFRDFTTDVVIAMFAVASERRDDFQRWNRVIMDSPQLKVEKDDPRFVTRANVKTEIAEFLEVQIADRQARFASGEKPDDLLALMVAAEGSNGITRAIVADNIFNLFLGGLDTTVRWMGNFVATLHRHPHALAEIVDDRSLIPQACEEVLRYDTIIQTTPRRVRPADLAIAGQLLPQGKEIFLMSAAGNRDPEVFVNPDRFDIHRPRTMHLGFGMGMHQCIGMHLARIEMTAFFNRFFDDVPRFSLHDLSYGSSWAIWGPERLVIALPR